jgi:hypothetical protein
MNADRLRLDLAELADDVQPVDLRDRVLRTSRRLRIQRTIVGSAAALIVLGAATGTALALTPRIGTNPAPAASATTVVTTAPTPPATPAPTTPAPVEPASSAPPEPARTTAAVDDLLSPTGLGPYHMGTSLSTLQAQGLVTDVREGTVCPSLGARGLRRYHRPYLHFAYYGPTKGRLIYLTVDSAQVKTAGGAHVGLTLAQVQTRHPEGRKLTGFSGLYAYLVEEGSNAMVFRFDKAGIVEAIEAGDRETVTFRFTDGEGC